jgi:REP element-mobilizing transposase RayT
MSYVKIWIHAVWTTKKRQPLLEEDKRPEIFNHIYANAIEKGILMDIVNGHTDHVHCLFRLKNDQTISKVMQLIKGESSFWVNQQKILKGKLQWQSDYYAVSVSESGVTAVKNYIKTQEEHHKKKTFTQEYDQFIEEHNFKIIED